MEYEYKVIDVADGAISSALLGEVNRPGFCGGCLV